MSDGEERNGAGARRSRSRVIKLMSAGGVAILAIAGAAALTTAANDTDGGASNTSGVAVVSGGSNASEAPTTTTASTAAATPYKCTFPSPGAVSVSGNQLYRDSQPWTPHAVQLIGLVQSPKIQQYWASTIDPSAPPDDLHSTEMYNNRWVYFKKSYARLADANYAEDFSEFDQIKLWCADSVRIQVSKVGIDPAPPSGDAPDQKFQQVVIDAIKYARSIGLTVIVSIQWERQISEAGPTNGVPDKQVHSDWAYLDSRLRKSDNSSDKGIIYEIMNEPGVKPTTDGWALWADAHNSVISMLRNRGATNVILADGASTALTLNGLPPLSDPLGQVFYSTHAYFMPGHLTQADWDTNFGNLAQRFPVINGEWTTLNGNGEFDPNNPDKGYRCQTTDSSRDDYTPKLALQLLSYQRQRHIGLVAVTFDTDKAWGNIVYNDQGDPTAATTFNGTNCNQDPRFGPGRVIQYWYRNNNLPGGPLIP